MLCGSVIKQALYKFILTALMTITIKYFMCDLCKISNTNFSFFAFKFDENVA